MELRRHTEAQDGPCDLVQRRAGQPGSKGLVGEYRFELVFEGWERVGDGKEEKHRVCFV